MVKCLYNMNKIILLTCLLTICGAQNNYCAFAYPEKGDSDFFEIRKTIELFVTDLALNRLESALKQVSLDYLDSTGKQKIDYSKFKTKLQEFTNSTFRRYLVGSVGNIMINKLVIKDDTATAKIEFTYNAFHIKSIQWISKKEKRALSLKKENGIWKIVRFNYN